jgi:hypothetical protein
LTLLKQKISFKHQLTPKNLITASFNTKKSHLSIVYYLEMKSHETALKEMILRNIVQASLSLRNIIRASFKLI